MKRLDGTPADEPFPEPEEALRLPEGLIAVGGCLSVPRLLNAYRSGVFPWFSEGEPLLWWSPDPRWVLRPAALRVSRSLRKRLRGGEFTVTHDRDFEAVIRACAEPRTGAEGTWISEDIIQAYLALHRAGHAHSFETWRSSQLVGGLYGVALGRMFFGESMFHRVTDASKVALVASVERLAAWGFGLIDCQLYTPHLERFGARALSRRGFIRCLRRSLADLPHPDAFAEPLE